MYFAIFNCVIDKDKGVEVAIKENQSLNFKDFWGNWKLPRVEMNLLKWSSCNFNINSIFIVHKSLLTFCQLSYNIPRSFFQTNIDNFRIIKEQLHWMFFLIVWEYNQKSIIAHCNILNLDWFETNFLFWHKWSDYKRKSIAYFYICLLINLFYNFDIFKGKTVAYINAYWFSPQWRQQYYWLALFWQDLDLRLNHAFIYCFDFS